MRRILGVATLAVVALIFTLVGVASGSPQAKPAPTANCPSNITNFVAANNVDAYSTSGTTTTTYFFSSLEDQDPSNGVPGLVGYCVYTDGVVQTADATPATWKQSWNSGNIAFVRGGGNKTNIPLDGATGTPIGTATFDEPWTTEVILLHIADAETCQDLYGGDATTCYVLPREAPAEPICNAGTGTTGALYNAIPTDVGDCAPPSLGFEATGTNEFGDEVTLDPVTGTIGSLTVDFQSYACSVSGQWQLGQTAPCASTPGATFPVDLTANIYEASAGGVPGTLLGTVTLDDYAMPYRPSADETNCPAGGNGTTIEDGSQWFNPAFGTCQFSISELVTFEFATPLDPTTGTVIWTVAFNTETAGYTPTGVDGPYDSLNVGVKSYPNAPYAGTDVSGDTVFWSYSGNSDTLGDETGWTGFRPLGQIAP